MLQATASRRLQGASMVRTLFLGRSVAVDRASQLVGRGPCIPRGEGEEGIASAGKNTILTADEREVARDLDTLDGHHLQHAGTQLLEYIDAGQKTDAHVPEDEPLEQFVRIEFHADTRNQLLLRKEIVELLPAAPLLGQKQAMLRNLRQGNTFKRCEGMTDRHDEDQFVFMDDLDVQALILEWKRYDAEVHLAIENKLERFCAFC